MKKPLSLSGYERFAECPRKFDLHYNKRIRPIMEPSYFIFGKAVDNGINALILKDGDPYKIAEETLKEIKNKKVFFIASDYDGELIEDDKKAELLEACRAIGYKGDDVDALVKSLMEKEKLSENQQKALAACQYESLLVKNRLMIDAYKSKVLPLFSAVENVQKEIKWKDEKGNEFVGVIDLTPTVKGYGRLTGDNKTSGNPQRDYAPGSVKSSLQLSLYSLTDKTEKGAYLVMGKNILKNRVKTCEVCGHVGQGKHKTCDNTDGEIRCGGNWIETIKPEVELHIVIESFDSNEKKIAQEALTSAAEAIKTGCFPLNLKACKQKFGQRESLCPYYNYCRTGSMEGLKVKEDEEK